MKIHLPTKALITTVATSLLIAGTFQTVDARDRGGRDGSRRHESRRTEQRSKKQPSSSRKNIKRHDRKDSHQSVAKKRHVTKKVVRQHHKRDHNAYNRPHRAKRVAKHDVIRRLPRGYRMHRSGKDRFYYHKGRYYRKHNHGYVRVYHPRLHRLPRHARRVVIDWVTYWICDDIFYIYRDGCYEICERPRCVTSTVGFGFGPLHFFVTDHDDCCY